MCYDAVKIYVKLPVNEIKMHMPFRIMVCEVTGSCDIHDTMSVISVRN